MPDNTNGDTSLDTGNFLWESNKDVVDSNIFSGRCAQLDGQSCSNCPHSNELHQYRFAYPYIPTCDYFHNGYTSCDKDYCGNTIQDSNWQYLTRGWSQTSNYGGQTTYKGDSEPPSLKFDGKADYPLAINAWKKDKNHASRLAIYAT